MAAGSCKIPGNPDIAGVGVRIAIYVQTLLCFFPAFWALFDGKVSQGELDAAENQATTNLVLAFAILISSIVQAQTLGLTNYHASIVLNMSWLNNTNAFIYFLLYIQHKSQPGIRGRVAPTWRAWAQHVRELVVSVVHRGTASSNQTSAGSNAELGQMKGADTTSIRSGTGRTQTEDLQGHDDYARAGAKLLVKRFVLLLGSLHLSLMAGLGLWLWSNIWAFGKGQDTANDCAAKHALLAILGKHVPFASEALRIISLAIYAVFLVPGVNLLLPIIVFLGFYHLHQVVPIPKVAGSEGTPDSYIHRSRFWFGICRASNTIVQRWAILPPCIGLLFLLAINLVFIIDIELALKQNAGLQGGNEAEWGFGQILAMLLLFMPLRDLAETILARRMKQRQKDLDMGLGGAINAKDRSMVQTWIARGANPNANFEGEISAVRMACNHEDWNVTRILLEAGADPNIEDGNRRDPSGRYASAARSYKIDSDNKDCLRLLNQVEKGSLDPVKALVQAANNGYGAAFKVFLGFLGIKLGEKESFLEALSGTGIDVNAGNTDGIASPAAAVTKAQEFETVILKLLLAAPGIDVNAPNTDGFTTLSLAARKGHQAIVKLLLAAPSIDVNAADTSGRTPLSFGAEKGHEAVVKLLLAAPGIDVNAPNTRGQTTLSFAAEGGHEAVVELLLAAPGIAVNAPDTNGRTPLRLAAEWGHEAVVKLLLAAPGIDVNVPNTNGWTPLIFAARYGYEAVAKLLLAAPGIDVNLPDPDGRTPLIIAARYGYEAVVKLLLAAPGIDVNAADTSGWTALTWAAFKFKGKEAIVQDLCAVPEIIVDVAEVKRHLESPPEGMDWMYAASKDKQDKCVRILEEFVESKGGGGDQDGSEGPGGG